MQLLHHPIDPNLAPYWNIQCDGQVAPMLQRVSATLVAHIQTGLDRPARAMLFNEMAANGYQNNSYHSLYSKAVELVSMLVVVDRQQGAARMNAYLDLYIKFRASTLARNSQLYAQCNFDGQRAIDEIIAQFNHYVADLERQYDQLTMRQGGMAGFGLHPNAMIGQNINQSLGTVPDVILQPLGATDVINQENRVGSSRYARNISVAAGASTQATEPTENAMIRSTTVLTNQPIVSGEKQTTIVPDIGVYRAQPAQPTTPVVTFERSDEVPYDIAYHPHLFERVVEKIGNICRVFFIHRSAMDRNKHLGRTSTMPSYVTPETVGHYEDRVAATTTPDDEIRVDVKFNAIFYLRSSLKQAMKLAQFGLIRSNVGNSKVCGNVVIGMVYEAVNPGTNRLEFVDALRATTTPQETVAAISKELESVGTNYQHLVAIRTVIARLTERFNRYVRLEAGLEYGEVTDFYEDVNVAVDDVLLGYYGKGVYTNFIKNYATILDEALNYAVSDEIKTYLQDDSTQGEGQEADAVDGEEQAVSLDERFIYFTRQVAVAAVNIASAELAIEITNPKLPAQVTKTNTPLLHAIIEGIEAELAKSGHSHTRLYLQLADGVVLDVLKGAFNPEARLVALEEACCQPI